MRPKTSSIPILGLLTWCPMSGYDIKQRIDESLGNFWSESFGQIYPRLSDLEAEGLISEVVQESGSERAKKIFTVTESGRDSLREWLSQAPSSRPPRNELLLKIFFATEGDLTAIRDHLESARAEAEKILARYKNIRTELETMLAHEPRAKFWIITVKNGISGQEAFLDWCEDSLVQLEDEGGSITQRREVDAG